MVLCLLQEILVINVVISLIDKVIDISKTFAQTAGNRILKKSAEATGDLIRNKIAEKITAKPIKNDVTNERYISPEERQEIINKLRLAKYNNGISKNR